MEMQKCCQCTRFVFCGADPCVICKCRAAQQECSNCCADRQCRNRSTRLIVSPLPPGDTSICHLVATAAPTHGQVRRDANSSRSQAEPVLPAQVDPTVDPPVAEEVPNEHSNAPHPTGTTNGTLSTPGTKIVALLDLSQDTDSGEVQATTEEMERAAEYLPEGGGTVELL